MSSADDQVLARVRGMRQGVTMRVLSPRHPMYGSGKCAIVDVAQRDSATPDYSKILYEDPNSPPFPEGTLLCFNIHTQEAS